MNKALLLAITAAWVWTSSAAGSAPSALVLEAIQALDQEPSYSWTSTTVSEPRTSLSRQSPTEGKTERDGSSYFTFTMDGNKVEAAFREKRAAIKTEAKWEAIEELVGERLWIARRLADFQTPGAEAEDLVKRVSVLKQGRRGSFTGELTPDGVRELLLARSREAVLVQVAPGARGSVTFWVKGGRLEKFEYTLQGRMILQDHPQEFAINRTTTVEIKNVGKTKVQLPAEADQKLSGPAVP